MIACPSCHESVAEYAEGRLPPWCPKCGADLKSPTSAPASAAPVPDGNAAAAEPAGSIVVVSASRSIYSPSIPAPRPRLRPPVLVIALVLGCIAGAFVFGLLRPAQPPPPIVRDAYSVQAPDASWSLDEEHELSPGSDLLLQTKHRGGDVSFFEVKVVPSQPVPPTLRSLADQLKRDWQGQKPSWQFQGSAGGTTAVAHQPAERIVAVAEVGGKRRRREALVLVHHGVGYRLTCEADEARFNSLRRSFDRLVGSFTPVETPAGPAGR